MKHDPPEAYRAIEDYTDPELDRENRIRGRYSIDVSEIRHWAELSHTDPKEMARRIEALVYKATGKIINLTGCQAEPPKPNLNCKPQL